MTCEAVVNADGFPVAGVVRSNGRPFSDADKALGTFTRIGSDAKPKKGEIVKIVKAELSDDDVAKWSRGETRMDHKGALTKVEGYRQPDLDDDEQQHGKKPKTKAAKAKHKVR